MPHILKNSHIELQIDFPDENYCAPRFDWTGKISAVSFKNVPITSTEKSDRLDSKNLGRGFYNEFGIDDALGFEKAKIGEWFHKIGVGLLQKDSDTYDFKAKFNIKPASFDVVVSPAKIKITCSSQESLGFAYVLTKEIELLPDGFVINYRLENTGTKPIITNEYNHNFLAFNNEKMSQDYRLIFPYALDENKCDERVNKENAVIFAENEISLNQTPERDFFFSNLSGGEKVAAHWQLINTKQKLGISETASFKTNKINLWGWGHVVCPELFFAINLPPGQMVAWSRTYKIFEV